jgi:hypothetical protein
VEQPRDFGIPGVTIEPGDHICALYLSEPERDSLILPFLRAGLTQGDKVICVVDVTKPAAMLSGIAADGSVDVDGAVASQQLDVQTSGDTYLSSGSFSGERMLEFWDTTVGAVINEGRFPFVRATGEMPFSLRDEPDREQFFEYEAELNNFMPRYPQAILCLYDLDLFGGGIVVDLIRTHPKLLLGGLLFENPYYQSPADLLATGVTPVPDAAVDAVIERVGSV